MGNNRPFLLKPAAKDYLWGGNRLNDDFGKNIDVHPLAETWECSTHPDGPSTAASGEYSGMTLTEVLRKHPEYLGAHGSLYGSKENPLPVLIKFIDAAKDLSIQVHPDDVYAKTHEHGQLGKTEMWYVLDAAKDATLIYGMRRDVTKGELKQRLLDGTAEPLFQKVPIAKNDVFVIEPGTIHAIGAGALIAEIQESSNLTYRLYDYNSVDKNGQKRPLHIEKALDVADLKAKKEPVQPMRVLRYKPGCANELLYRCKYFQTERMILNTQKTRTMAEYQTDGLSFAVFLCVEGCGTLFAGNAPLNFYKGDCIFIPAESVPIQMHGMAQILKVTC